MSECIYARKCLNFVQAKHIVTGKPLTPGICAQMNCKHNPMRKYEVDLLKTRKQRIEEEANKIRLEEEIERRAQIKVEQKLDLKKRPPHAESDPIIPYEQPTKYPKQYASVKDVIKKVAEKERERKMETDDYLLQDDDFLNRRVEKKTSENERIEKDTTLRYPKITVAAPSEQSENYIPPSVYIAEEAEKIIPKTPAKQAYPSIREIKEQITPSEEEYYRALDKEIETMNNEPEEIDEDQENIAFMLASIKRTKSIKTLKQIIRQADEEGYPDVVFAAKQKIDKINKDKMARVRAAKES